MIRPKQHYDHTVKMANQREVKSPFKLLGSTRPQKGQLVWQVDRITKVIEPAPLHATATIKGGIHKKLVVEPNKMYCLALNRTNAIRKFIKMLLDERKA